MVTEVVMSMVRRILRSTTEILEVPLCVSSCVLGCFLVGFPQVSGLYLGVAEYQSLYPSPFLLQVTHEGGVSRGRGVRRMTELVWVERTREGGGGLWGSSGTGETSGRSECPLDCRVPSTVVSTSVTHTPTPVGGAPCDTDTRGADGGDEPGSFPHGTSGPFVFSVGHRDGLDRVHPREIAEIS